MSKFFVGQRVRIKFARTTGRVPVGAEGRITGIWDSVSDIGLPNECSVLFSEHVCPEGSGDYGVVFDQLEPILPEGSAPSEFTFQQLMDNLQEVMA